MIDKMRKATDRVAREVPGSATVVAQMRQVMLIGDLDHMIAYLDNLNQTNPTMRKPVIDIFFDEVYS
jgi:hypothetical protein